MATLWLNRETCVSRIKNFNFIISLGIRNSEEYYRVLGPNNAKQNYVYSTGDFIFNCTFFRTVNCRWNIDKSPILKFQK